MTQDTRIDPRKKEFLEIAHRAGWPDAELARKLEITRGGMHGIMKGGTIPSSNLLKLLRYVVRDEKPSALTPRSRGGATTVSAAQREAKTRYDDLDRKMRLELERHTAEIKRLFRLQYPGAPVIDPAGEAASMSDRAESSGLHRGRTAVKSKRG